MLAQIISAATTHKNAEAYAAARDKYLFAEQLLLDAGVRLSLRIRPDETERAVTMLEDALEEHLAVSSYVSDGLGEW